MRLSELQNKNVVNIIDGKNIGNIIDIRINEQDGTIMGFVIEPSKNLKSFFGKYADTEIEWKNITKIGEDVILVKIAF